MMSQKAPLLAIILVGLIFSGCASMKADPSAGAGFVPMQEMAQKSDLPFNKAWVKDGMEWKNYQTIYIKPVNTAYMMETETWKQNFRQGRMKEDAQELARYMEDRFRSAFATSQDNQFRAVGYPEPGSLTLEMALTELVPSNVALEILGYGPYGSGTVIKLLSRSSGAVTTVAFEAKVRDSKTGTVVAMFADREIQKYKFLDFKGFTWYGNARNIIDDWADQMVQVANKRPGQVVEAASTFSLKRW
ncbi:MAG: DUF3313 domain-containing protein [Deltaproteobacteria bacterium]|nr:DUF3313 domain-containing protein [Deltaproteobacteria bacterium]